MDIKKRTFQIAVILAIAYYIIDALIGALSDKETGFFEMLITAVPFQELYSRLLAVAFIIILGIIFSYFISITPDQQKKKGNKEHTMSSDPMLMVNVSNHIRTPLNAIQGFIEMLDDTDISNSSRELYINHIRTSSKFLLELINNVTDITLIESNSLYLDKTECKLNEVMSDIQSKYNLVVQESQKQELKVQLKTNIRDKEFTIMADPKRLRQILENLIENAVHFTDEGTVEFGYMMREENNIEFYVKDTGQGFSEERLKILMTQTGQMVDKRMAPFDIASLRIKIAMKLVDLMGGVFKASSQVNKGSDFRFTIPVKINALNKEEGPGGSLEDYGTHGEKEYADGEQWAGKTILIAEDVESNFIYLSEILKDTGVNILWAENGKVACEIAKRNSKIDLILMDILMPEMDGYEATVKIKEDRPEVPVIAQTAYHLDEDDYRDAGTYFSKVLIKPIWSHDLMNALEEEFK